MHRLLILACSATKRHDPGLMPATRRYDGPSFRTLRRYLADNPHQDSAITVLILSAQLGLITTDTRILDYDQRMDAGVAAALRPQVATVLARHLRQQAYDATFVTLGADYAPALTITDDLRLRMGTLTVASGGIGTRLGQLRRWLITGP